VVIGDALSVGVERLQDVGITSARLDCEVLLSGLLQKERLYLLLHKNDALDEEVEKRFFDLIERRAAHEPVAYLLGEKEFMSLPFAVSPGILIPRPDTETLVEYAIGELKEVKDARVLDICTGSGAIAVSLAYYLPQISVSACDISPHCVSTAQENAKRNGVAERVSVFCQDVFLPFEVQTAFDCLVSNPPYIPSAVLPTLEQDVGDYEPSAALDGGDDGLIFYRRLIHLAPQLVRSGGLVAFEVGHDQAEAVSLLMEQAHFAEVKQLPDLSGILRVVCGRLPD